MPKLKYSHSCEEECEEDHPPEQLTNTTSEALLLFGCNNCDG